MIPFDSVFVFLLVFLFGVFVDYYYSRVLVLLYFVCFILQVNALLFSAG